MVPCANACVVLHPEGAGMKQVGLRRSLCDSIQIHIHIVVASEARTKLAEEMNGVWVRAQNIVWAHIWSSYV